MLPLRRDSWVTFAVCLLIGSLVFIDTLDYPGVQGQGFGHGPAFYPRVLAGVLMVLGLFVVFQGLRHDKTVHGVKSGLEGAPAEVDFRSVVVFMALCVATILSMTYLGFLVSGFLLAFVSTMMIRASFKARDVTLGFLYSFGIMALVYVVFNVFVGVQLPGSAFFR